MIRWFYILLISILLPVFVSGQSLRCMYDELTAKACQERDFIKAKAYSDSTLSNCPDLFENPYVWYLRGFTLYQLYKQQGAYSDSPLREDALEALNRSIVLDSVKHQFEGDVKRIIKNIATTYWNNAAVSMDTNSFNKALDYYGKYKRAIKIALPDFDLSEREIEFKRSLGLIYEEKFNNNKKLYAEYIDLSINCFKEVLEIDSMHYDANFNIGKIYHNLAVDIIINEIPKVDDLELFFMFEEQTVEYFSNALPYFKRAYLVQPQNQQVVQGMAAVYYSLHDEEKHKIYMDVLKGIQNEEIQQINPPNSSSTWDPNKTYVPGDVVEFSGSYFKAITSSTGVSPNSSATDWEKL